MKTSQLIDAALARLALLRELGEQQSLLYQYALADIEYWRRQA